MDSSAVVRRYFDEAGSDWVRAVTDPDSGQVIYVATPTIVEVIGAISRAEKRQRRLSSVDADLLIRDFRYDWEHQYRVVRLTPEVIAQAVTVGRGHALRGYDAIQLASALALQLELGSEITLQFASGDKELNEAADREGLTVIDLNLL